jgi:hypothetical protein
MTDSTKDAIWIAVHFYGRIRGLNLRDPAFVARGRAARAKAETFFGSGGVVGGISPASKVQAQVYSVLNTLGTTAEERRFGLRFVRAWLRGGRAAAEAVLASGPFRAGGGASTSAATAGGGSSAGTAATAPSAAPARQGAYRLRWVPPGAGARSQAPSAGPSAGRSRYPMPVVPGGSRYPMPVVPAPSGFRPSGFRAGVAPGVGTRPRDDDDGLVIDLDAYRRSTPQGPDVSWRTSQALLRGGTSGGGTSRPSRLSSFSLDYTRLPPTGIAAVTGISPVASGSTVAADVEDSAAASGYQPGPYAGPGDKIAAIGSSAFDQIKPFALPLAALGVAALIAWRASSSSGSAGSSRRRRNSRGRRNGRRSR